MKTLLLFPLLVVLHSSCHGQGRPGNPAFGEGTGGTLNGDKWKSQAYLEAAAPDSALQISQYIPCIMQDRAGNIWFGTNGDGVCRYDGNRLTYFTTTEGFGGTGVRDMIEVENGDLWFATTNGVTRYNGKRFTNFTTREGLLHNQVWSILKDGNGAMWFGTDGGVCRYDGKKFIPFHLPVADITKYPGTYPAPKLVYHIMQDKRGDIWLATNGAGVFRYDGMTLTNISKKDGLASDVVIDITEGRDGDLWFGCTEGYQGPDKQVVGGVTRYDGKTFTSFTTREGLSGNMVWTVQGDRKGNVWIATGRGIDRYDGKSFVNFTKKDGLASRFVQAIMEDRSGILWFGTSDGVYRYDGGRFINFTKDGLVP